MKSDEQARHSGRDTVLELLSDAEIARVRAAESGAQLEDGEEFLDLEALERGVRRALGRNTPMGRVLPKKAVHETTWGKILEVLADGAIGAPHPGETTGSSH